MKPTVASARAHSRPSMSLILIQNDRSSHISFTHGSYHFVLRIRDGWTARHFPSTHSGYLFFKLWVEGSVVEHAIPFPCSVAVTQTDVRKKEFVTATEREEGRARETDSVERLEAVCFSFSSWHTASFLSRLIRFTFSHRSL